MDNDFEKMLQDIESKTEYTDEEKDEMYYTYSKNLLLASYEFKLIDSTLSELFLSLSKMMINKLATKYNIENENGTNNQEQYIENMIKSKFESLSNEEKTSLLSEIEDIEKNLES